MKRNLGPISFLAILILLMVSCARLPGDIINITLTPSNDQPKQGQTIQVTVKVERVNGYNKPLTVKLDPVPPGVTAPDASIAGNVDSTVVDVKLDQAGEVNLNFKISGDGITTKEQLLGLKVLPTENFELKVEPVSLAKNPGTTDKVKVTVTRNATMNQAITVSVTGLPTGVTVAPITIPANVSTGDLSFVIAANAPAVSNKDLTITAIGQGITKTAPFKLTVNLVADFTLAFDPPSFNSLAIGQGGTGQVKVKVTRNTAHTDPITLSLEGLPAKVTGPNPNVSVPAGQTDGTLNLTVAPDAATVSGATVTVKAVGQGVTKTLTFALTISNVIPEITSLTLSPDPLTVSQGASNTLSVTVVRNATLTGAITVSVATTGPNALPSGVTAPNITIPAGSNSGILTLTATAGATLVNNAAVAVTATSGAATRTKNFALTVQAGPGFSLATSVPEITVLKAASGNVTVTLSRDAGFTSDVALTLEGAPAGVTATFTPSTLINGGATTSTLKLDVSNSVVPTVDGFTLTVKGTSAAKTATQTLKLLVPELTITAANLNIVRGDNPGATLTVNVSRKAFTGDVQVALSGLPTGVSSTAVANTITVLAGATSGVFTLNAAEDMFLDPLVPAPEGNQTSTDKLIKELTLSATVASPALNSTAKPILTVKPQFEIKIFKGQQAGTGTCLNNPIDSVTLQQGAVGIKNPTTPESDWICLTVVRNGTFANRPAGQNHVFWSYQALSNIAESGQSESGYGFFPSETATGSTKGNFFLKAKAGVAAGTYNFYVRAYEVVTPDSGSGAVIKDGQGGRKLVATDAYLKLIVTP